MAKNFYISAAFILYRVSFGADGGVAPAGELAKIVRPFSNVRNDACKHSIKAVLKKKRKNTKPRHSFLYRVSFGADDRIRTGDLRLTKALRYHLCHISRVLGVSNHIKKMVEVTGFEPAAPTSRT